MIQNILFGNFQTSWSSCLVIIGGKNYDSCSLFKELRGITIDNTFINPFWG